MTELTRAAESPVDPVESRRWLFRATLGGLAAAATVGVGRPDEAAAAPSSRERARARRRRRHARRCQHWHRCALHRSHTCRHLHRCPHRFHRAAPPTPPADPPTNPPGPDLTDPVFPEVPIPAPGEALPSDALRVLSRFTHGYHPTLHRQLYDAGTVEAWFAQQLDPDTLPDADADAIAGWWPSLTMPFDQLWQRHVDGTEYGWTHLQNYARWCLMRRIHSTRQVHEVVSEFWEDHLHIPLSDDNVFPYRADYGVTIRRHALGRFADLLRATITHPAMSLSLDNAYSTRTAPNENLGRELLELHTVGVGNFTEDDVKASARILTGYRVDVWGTWAATYEPSRHWTGPVQVLDFQHANQASDGRPVVAAYLDHLARHPLTARRIARKLAVRFVGDQPPESLIDHLAAVYLAHDTDIRPVLRSLMRSVALREAPRQITTPLRDLVATQRALRVEVAAPTQDTSAANALLWYAAALGQMPFEWTRPDGPPANGAAWSSTSRFLSAAGYHLSAAAGWDPVVDVTYRPRAAWFPDRTVSFADLVDHLSIQLFGHPADDRVRAACAEAFGGLLADLVTAVSPLATWRLPNLLAVLLDSPEHLMR